MGEKLTFTSWATALVDTHAVSMSVAHSLKAYHISVVKTHILEACYCRQPEAHLCNNHGAH